MRRRHPSNDAVGQSESHERVDLRERIIELQGENAMLLNAIQRAQLLVVEERYDEADLILREVIAKVLATPPPGDAVS